MPRKAPSYRLHSSGQATVRLDGHDYYLGKYGTPQSQAEYDRLIALWLAGGRRMPGPAAPDLTISEVLDRYWQFARGYYRQPDIVTGELVETKQINRLRYALGVVRQLYGSITARDFGPLALKACRQKMIDKNWCRKNINQQIDAVKRVFKWAVAEEILPSSAYESLRAVVGLRAGRTLARESGPVKPVPEEQIPPVKALVLPAVAAMIDLQLLTAARPGEVINLRPCDLDRSGAVWLYKPARHKTQHHDHERIIFLGPQAQAALLPYLDRAPRSFCFSPREATAAHYARLGCRPGPLRYHDRYQAGSYSHAIRSACRRAGIYPWWSPHRLRHNAATRLVAEFGWEVARIILGHRTLSATRIYGEDAVAKAIEVMKKVG